MMDWGMKTKTTRGNFLAAVIMLLAASAFHAMAEEAGVKKLVMIAGNPSHPAGMHEFNAGCLLLQKCLSGVKGLKVEVNNNHRVSGDRTLEDADAVVICAEGVEPTVTAGDMAANLDVK